MKKNILKDKCFDFAVQSVLLFKRLSSEKEFILSRQFMRSSTSVGANIREANNAQSNADFVHKLHISQKECEESKYWLELMLATSFIDKEEFDFLFPQADEISKIIKSSILTTKARMRN